MIDSYIAKLGLDNSDDLNELEMAKWKKGDRAARKLLSSTLSPEYTPVCNSQPTFKEAYDAIVRTKIDSKQFIILYGISKLLNISLDSLDTVMEYLRKKRDAASSVKAARNPVITEEIVNYLHSASLLVGIPEHMAALRRSLEDLITIKAEENNGYLNPHDFERVFVEELARYDAAKGRHGKRARETTKVHLAVSKGEQEENNENGKDNENRKKRFKATCQLCDGNGHKSKQCFWNPKSTRFDGDYANFYRNRNKSKQPKEEKYAALGIELNEDVKFFLAGAHHESGISPSQRINLVENETPSTTYNFSAKDFGFVNTQNSEDGVRTSRIINTMNNVDDETRMHQNNSSNE